MKLATERSPREFTEQERKDFFEMEAREDGPKASHRHARGEDAARRPQARAFEYSARRRLHAFSAAGSL